ncbi:transcriptional regulator [Leptospira barantonii]|uniref:Transcriptional regulator n=1 Tax=Leptospira barantonii TaxID=2023184 RepID=A0ABX4NRP4_9LEPT|nr:helix-turn-helix transcriptional regulator [Leptospira barantonii]PJZ57678.1 transcriptional regulator [Leptospira barantonii]
MESDEFRKKLGNKIQSLRKVREITQEDMDDGTEISVHFRTIQEIESGRANTTINTILKIAKRFKVKPKDLLDI